MYPYLFEIGPISVGTFGLMVALGFLAALYVLNREFKRQGLHKDLGSTIVTTCMVGGIVGAKLYFVLFETSPETWDEFFDLLFSGYGLTWYGGFVVAAAGVLWQIRRHNAPLGHVADAVGIALAVGYGVGRIGCQLAGDGDYGVPTDLPWGMAYPDGVVPTTEKVHPAPVYETLSHLGIAAFLWKMRTRFEIPGLSFSFYLILAGLARFLVEFIRINPPALWGLSQAQLLSIAMIAFGLGLMLYLQRRREAP